MLGVGGCVQYAAQNTLFRIAVQNGSTAKKGFPNSMLYQTTWSEQIDRPQVATCAKALKTGVSNSETCPLLRQIGQVAGHYAGLVTLRTATNCCKFAGKWCWFSRHSGLCSARSALLMKDVMPSEKLIVLLYCEVLPAAWRIFQLALGVSDDLRVSVKKFNGV